MTRQSLPTRLPLFPLPNLVLFPAVRLPLHLFEPRYRAMMEAALEGDRVIGMLQLRPDVDAMQERAPGFDVGCVGSIVDWSRLRDGRYNLIVEGERRFRLRSDVVTDGGFRMAEVELLDDLPFGELAADARRALEAQRATLEALALGYVGATAPQAVETLRGQLRELDPLALVHALAFALDWDPLERQGLLEASDPVERGHLLIHLIEFRQAELQLPERPRTLN